MTGSKLFGVQTVQPPELVANTQPFGLCEDLQVTFNLFRSPVASLLSVAFTAWRVSWLTLVSTAWHWSHLNQNPPPPEHTSLWSSFFQGFYFFFLHFRFVSFRTARQRRSKTATLWRPSCTTWSMRICRLLHSPGSKFLLFRSYSLCWPFFCFMFHEFDFFSFLVSRIQRNGLEPKSRSSFERRASSVRRRRLFGGPAVPAGRRESVRCATLLEFFCCAVRYLSKCQCQFV